MEYFEIKKNSYLIPIWPYDLIFARNDPVFAIFQQFEQLLDILTNLMRFYPYKPRWRLLSLINGILWNAIFPYLIPIWPDDVILAPNDPIVGIFRQFEQFLDILTTLMWFLPI